MIRCSMICVKESGQAENTVRTVVLNIICYYHGDLFVIENIVILCTFISCNYSADRLFIFQYLKNS